MNANADGVSRVDANVKVHTDTNTSMEVPKEVDADGTLRATKMSARPDRFVHSSSRKDV